MLAELARDRGRQQPRIYDPRVDHDGGGLDRRQRPDDRRIRLPPACAARAVARSLRRPTSDARGEDGARRERAADLQEPPSGDAAHGQDTGNSSGFNAWSCVSKLGNVSAGAWWAKPARTTACSDSTGRIDAASSSAGVASSELNTNM